MSPLPAIGLGIVLLLLNAFFVGAEFAILSARRSQIEPKAAAGSRAAKTVLWAMEHVSLMLACAQLGVTICSTSLGVIAEPAIAKLVERPMVALGLPQEASHVVGFIVALLLVVYLHVVVGEMIPKNLAVSSPDTAVLYFGPPLVWFSRVLKPIILALNWLANSILRLLRIEPKDEVASAFTAEEVAGIVDMSRAQGLLSDDQGLLTGALEFSDLQVADAMVSVDDLVLVGEKCTPEELEAQVARTGFSRFPVVDTDERLTGYLHIKDTLYAEGAERAEPIEWWRVRQLAQVQPNAEIEDALAVMQRTGAHLAAVIDEHNRTRGVLFLEDILEELVGEVRDEMQRRQRSS